MIPSKLVELLAMLTILVFSVPGLQQFSHAQDVSPETGRFSVSTTTAEIIGADGAQRYANVVGPNAIQGWEVVVPDHYDSAEPPGVLVYISPSNSGKIPLGWNRALEKHNLIWVAANNSGNPIAVALRITKALLGAALINGRYEIDRQRVYLSGFSGGARVAGLAASVYPTLFRGAIYIGGAEPWDEGIDTEMLDVIRNNRYVFMAGSNDFNRTNVRTVRKFYRDAGVTNTDIMILHQTGHELPKRSKLAAALEYLDASDNADSKR